MSLCVIPTLAAGQTVTVEATLNATFFLFQETFTSEDQRVWQVNIDDPNALQPNNTLTLIRAGGLGAVRVSNCVVHFNT